MELKAATSVRGAIEAALTKGIAEATFRRRVWQVLETYPGPLHPAAPLRAATFALGAYRASGGASDLGYSASGAMELLTVGLHLLDRVADQEAPQQGWELQMAPTLLFLTSYMLDDVRQTRWQSEGDVKWGQVYALMTTVCAGQQDDIDLQQAPTCSLEEARTMTERKTGAYGETLALVGALAACASHELTAELALFGFYAGTWSQLVDDATDVSTKSPNTSDVRLAKKTVPLAFFLWSRGDRAEWDRLRDALVDGNLSPGDEEGIRRTIEECGALDLTLTLASWYRIKAEGVLSRLRSRGCDVSLLEDVLAALVPERQASWQEASSREAGTLSSSLDSY